jgi:hypothetical protein
MQRILLPQRVSIVAQPRDSGQRLVNKRETPIYTSLYAIEARHRGGKEGRTGFQRGPGPGAEPVLRHRAGRKS